MAVEREWERPQFLKVSPETLPVCLVYAWPYLTFRVGRQRGDAIKCRWGVKSGFKVVWMESTSPCTSLIGYSLKWPWCSLVWTKSRWQNPVLTRVPVSNRIPSQAEGIYSDLVHIMLRTKCPDVTQYSHEGLQNQVQHWTNKGRICLPIHTGSHRLNMEVDLQSLFWLYVT
jgi:hypothetical protein